AGLGLGVPRESNQHLAIRRKDGPLKPLDPVTQKLFASTYVPKSDGIVGAARGQSVAVRPKGKAQSPGRQHVFGADLTRLGFLLLLIARISMPRQPIEWIDGCHVTELNDTLRTDRGQ